MTLRVTQFGEPVLREVGKPVVNFDETLQKLAQDMFETMYASEGVGLAAQQIDQALQLCVVDPQMPPSEVNFEYSWDGKQPPLDLLMPLALCNPQITPLPGKRLSQEEGCLSFPGIRFPVTRDERIQVDYQDLQGTAHTLICSGWLARIIQHEVDHLQGVLFIDHMDGRARLAWGGKIKRLKRATRDELRSRNQAS